MNRAPWLEPARRQARALVDARLERPRPAFVAPRRRGPVLPVVLALAIVASTAWAWTRTVEPQLLVERPVAAPVAHRPPRLRVAPTVAPTVDVHEAPPTPPVVHVVEPNEVDEPFGDVIEVKRPSNLPPLFDVGEYRSRGVMVK